MKETGIVMTGDHPAKILADLKTMTRRTNGLDKYNKEPDKWNIGEVHAGPHKFWSASCDWSYSYRIDCPYGQVGDRLWVRETWAGQDFAICNENYSPVYLGKDGLYHPAIHKSGRENYAWGLQGEPKWRSSRFMQKIATRIWLEIIGVRVERLQEITRSDALAEGCLFEDTLHYIEPKLNLEINWYRKLWDSLNAKRGYGWADNPWVWVLAFRRIDS